MTEQEIELLIFALQMGWKAINGINNISGYIEDFRNDYFLMVQNLGEKIGANLDSVTD